MGGATRACRCLGRLDAAAAECHVRTHDAPPIADEAVRIARSSRVLVAAALVALAVAAAVLAPDPAVWLEASRDVTGWTERNRGLGAGLFLAFATLGKVTPVPGGVVVMLTAGYLFGPVTGPVLARSEEHTSELQSLMRISYAVFCLK